jgi:hypothetical protein
MAARAGARPQLSEFDCQEITLHDILYTIPLYHRTWWRTISRGQGCCIHLGGNSPGTVIPSLSMACAATLCEMTPKPVTARSERTWRATKRSPSAQVETATASTPLRVPRGRRGGASLTLAVTRFDAHSPRLGDILRSRCCLSPRDGTPSSAVKCLLIDFAQLCRRDVSSWTKCSRRGIIF